MGKNAVLHQALAADKPHFLIPAHFPHIALGFVVVLHHDPPVPQGQLREQLFQGHLAIAILRVIQYVDEPLRKAMLLRDGGVHCDRRPVQVGKPWIIRRRPIDGLRSKPHDQPQHARLRVHVRIPLIGAVAVTDSGGTGHEVPPPITPGHPLDQYGHLLVTLVQSAPEAVFQRGWIHGAGVYRPHRVFKGIQALVLRSAVDTEYGFIFSGKGVPEAVLQKPVMAVDILVLVFLPDILDGLIIPTDADAVVECPARTDTGRSRGRNSPS